MQKERTIIAALVIVVIAGFWGVHSRYSALDDVAYEVTIEAIDHQQRNSSEVTLQESKPFSRYEGDALGLDRHMDFSALDFVPPFLRASGIASGDFNNDGWQDILLANRSGILLYKNLGTNRFTLQEIVVREVENLSTIVVAFVDIDNDGWQDIYLTSYGGKNYFLLNDGRGFQNPEIIEAPNGNAIVTNAASFADLYGRDGYLDFIQGNWFFGGRRQFTSKLSENIVITNRGLNLEKRVLNDIIRKTSLSVLLPDLIKDRSLHLFQEKAQKEIIGETLSVLFSDFTNDHSVDLIVGNDFAEPDIFYIGNAEGELREIGKADTVIPISAHDTMSVDVADFNNDLYMDIYVSGISSGYPTDVKRPQIDFCLEIKSTKEKQKCENNLQISEIVKKRNIEGCMEQLTNAKDKNDCIVMIILNLAVVDIEDESLCEKIPAEYQIQKLRCHDYFTPGIDRASYESSISQKDVGNVLLQGSKEGAFQDVSDKTGSGKGGWAWNSKFADLDNDEWQDIYVVNGRWDNQPPHSNVFFHNHIGQFFETVQEAFNLENFNMVTSYTYIDIDNDGDLDIITAGLNGPTNVYLNNETKNNSITFEFRDKKGNHFGIGNKIYIYYGENGERHQVREIKSGGGFLSFDSPIAHFGLGEYDTVNKVDIAWSTGEKTVIDKEFLANKHYVISRGK